MTYNILKDYIDVNLIELDVDAQSKDKILEKLVFFFDNKYTNSHKKLYKDILKRESEITTGIGNGIAIPHAKSKACIRPGVLFARTNDLIKYKALDNKDVGVFFMIITPDDNPYLHLNILAVLAKKLMEKEVVDVLKTSKLKEEILNQIIINI